MLRLCVIALCHNRTIFSIIGLGTVIFAGLFGLFSSVSLENDDLLETPKRPRFHKIDERNLELAALSQIQQSDLDLNDEDFFLSNSSLTTTRSVLASDSYIFRAYIDSRSSAASKLRILAFRNCKFWSEKLLATLEAEDGKNSVFDQKLTVESLNGDCPWHWAPSCKLDPHFLTASLPVVAGSKFTKLTIRNSQKSLVISNLHYIPKVTNYKHQLAVCVIPLYLYADWLQMVQFLELWKIAGATKFTIYVTSVTKTMFSFLEAYQKAGSVEIVPWPLLPKKNQENPSLEDPNSSIYRFGHILALNDCILRSVGVAKFVAPVDFDEFILPKKDLDLAGLLNSLAKSEPRAGSFKFSHTRLYYPDSYDLPWSVNLRTFNLNYLSKLRQSYLKGPSKVVVRPERALITLNHASRRMMTGFQRATVERASGELYHLRRAPVNPGKSENVGTFRRFHKVLPAAATSFMTMAQSYLPDGKSGSLRTGKAVLKAVTGCLSNWKHSGCKVPHDMCGKKVFVNRTDWIIFDSDKMESGRDFDKFLLL